MADEQINLEDGDSGAAATTPAKPDWLEPQFESVEAQAKSYAEARAEMARAQAQAEQERTQFSEALAMMQAEQDTRARQMADPQSDPRIQAYQRAMDEGDAATALAVNLDLTRQLIQQELQASQSSVTPQLQQVQQAQRAQQIDMAEQSAREYAISRGLNYDESRDDVLGALRGIYGDGLLPAEGDVATYTRAINSAVDITLAQAIVQDVQSGEADRRAKLSAMTTTPGASGRLATGSPDEQSEWAKVQNAPAGSYSELMAQQSRRG